MPIYFGDKIRAARKAAKLTQKQLASKIDVSNTSISNWEKNVSRPDPDTIQHLCWALNVDPNYFFPSQNAENLQNVDNDIVEVREDILVAGDNRTIMVTGRTGAGKSRALIDNIISVPQMRKIPLIGSIACGAPILAEEHIEEYIDIPKHISADFALTCKGDSMINARIFDGDIVYIRQQDTVNNGEIAAVLIDTEATLKRVQLFEDHISLEPENPQYRPLVYWGEEMNDVRILGKAMAFTSAVR